MSRSVPSASEAQATFAATLFDEWIHSGLRDVVVSPGSRSTPLVLAVSECPELTVHVRLDERSAGFFALGRALATKAPVVVVVTSGTAAAELHACVAEADLACVPLIIVTADRPPELHGVGAPQTMEQAHLYGGMVRHFEEPGVARMEVATSWRPLAKRLWRYASGGVGVPGPVHLNAAFVEPLVSSALGLPARVVEDEPDRRVQEDLPAITTLNVAGQSILCVVGSGVSAQVIKACVELNWVVLGDATAEGSLSYYDALLRAGDFAARVRPDVVIRLGGLPASKVLADQLRSWVVRTVGLSGAGFIADPDRLIGEFFAGLPTKEYGLLEANPNYAQTWRRASDEVAQWVATLESSDVALNEPLVARAVVALSSASGASLVVGSSMPVRDVEWWAPPRQSATYANRGVNGIDGVVSTVLGVASGSKALGLLGDLTMLHDVSGFVDGLGRAGGTCVLVVIDNRGGGIFSFLPQAVGLETARFEEFFGTPRPHNIEALASAFGYAAATAATLDELRNAVEKGLAAEGLSVVVASVPSREENVNVHQTWNTHVTDLLARS